MININGVPLSKLIFVRYLWGCLKKLMKIAYEAFKRLVYENSL